VQVLVWVAALTVLVALAVLAFTLVHRQRELRRDRVARTPVPVAVHGRVDRPQHRRARAAGPAQQHRHRAPRG
jgi:hypothetical protein